MIPKGEYKFMDRNNIERPKAEKKEKIEKKKFSVQIRMPKKYEQFWRKSVKESGLSNLQFIIKLSNEYAKEYNLNIGYIPMPKARGREEGYNNYKK
jgi:hypothetical protein